MAVQPTLPCEAVHAVSNDIDSDASGTKEMPDRDQASLMATVAGLAGRLDRMLEDVETLRRKQDWIGRRHDEAESTHRGQLDCVSERLYNAEKELRQVQKMQDDAVEKANAAFQKHSNEVLQDRQHMTSAISQVNQNFEQVSSEMVHNSAVVKAGQLSVGQMQADLEQLSYNLMGHGSTAMALQQDVGGLHATAQEQHQQIQELHLALQAVHETMKHMTPHTQFLEAETRQRMIAQALADIQDQVAEMRMEWQGHMGPMHPSSAGQRPARDSRTAVRETAALAPDARRRDGAFSAPTGSWLSGTADARSYAVTGPADHAVFTEEPRRRSKAHTDLGGDAGVPDERLFSACDAAFARSPLHAEERLPRGSTPTSGGGGTRGFAALSGEGGGRSFSFIEDESFERPQDGPWAWQRAYAEAGMHIHAQSDDERPDARASSGHRPDRAAFSTSIHDMPSLYQGLDRQGADKL